MYLVVFLAGPLVERIAIGARTLIFAKCYAFLGATIENGRRLRTRICNKYINIAKLRASCPGTQEYRHSIIVENITNIERALQ